MDTGRCDVRNKGKWFKHYCYWWMEEDVARFVAMAGLKGWGFLMAVFEIICAADQPDNQFKATYAIRTWCALLGIHRNCFNKQLAIALENGLLDAKLDRFINGDMCLEMCSPLASITLSCPKLLKVNNSSNEKSRHSQDVFSHKDAAEE